MCRLTETDNKDRLEALKFISQTHRSLHDQRRKAELQAFFTSATFYALIGAAKFTGRLTIPDTNRGVFLFGAWVLLFAVALVSSLYLWGLHAANTVNRRFAEQAEDQIMDALDLKKPEGAGAPLANTRIWQIAMIVILALGVGFAFTFF
ncbi:MAG: hypothetical protein AB1798_15955 [Spirochaetota bacterium]